MLTPRRAFEKEPAEPRATILSYRAATAWRPDERKDKKAMNTLTPMILNAKAISMNLDDTENDIVTVSCMCCAATFEGFSESQANDCASEYDPETRELTGYYGSTLIDLETHFVSPKIDMPHAIGNVCDPCIAKMMKNDGLILISAF